MGKINPFSTTNHPSQGWFRLLQTQARKGLNDYVDPEIN